MNNEGMSTASQAQMLPQLSPQEDQPYREDAPLNSPRLRNLMGTLSLSSPGLQGSFSQQQQDQTPQQTSSSATISEAASPVTPQDARHLPGQDNVVGINLPPAKDLLSTFPTTRANLDEQSTETEREVNDLFTESRDNDFQRLRNGNPSTVSNNVRNHALVKIPGATNEHINSSRRKRKGYREEGSAGPKKIRNGPKDGQGVVNKIVRHPELAIALALNLRVQDLLNLYSVSKDFNAIVNCHFTTIVTAQARQRAPESAKIFPFKCYASLCIEDPAQRQHPRPEKARGRKWRTVPSFRWLKMVCFREMVVHEIMVIMAEDGVPIPRECVTTLKKLWLLMDIPDNLRRVCLIRNNKIFTDRDLFYATMFFIKLDMRFTDPLTGSGTDGMKRMLLSQPSLSYLWRTLKRTILLSKLDVIEMYIRWKHVPEEADKDQPLFRIPPEEFGLVQYEAWGKSNSRRLLERPDELVMMESIHRGLKMHLKYTDMFLWGYVNPNTFENIGATRLERRLERLEGLERDLIPLEDRSMTLAPKQISVRVIQDQEPGAIQGDRWIDAHITRQ